MRKYLISQEGDKFVRGDWVQNEEGKVGQIIGFAKHVRTWDNNEVSICVLVQHDNTWEDYHEEDLELYESQPICNICGEWYDGNETRYCRLCHIEEDIKKLKGRI